jgi:DNA-binding CsgD family transcriptional regulator
MQESTEGVRKNLEKKLDALRQVDNVLPNIIIVHNLETEAIEYMSSRGLQIFGITLEEAKNLGATYHHQYFNPEDVDDYFPKMINLLKADMGVEKNRVISFFQQLRPSDQHDWSWYLSTAKVFLRNATGKPTHLITSSASVDPLHHVTAKVSRMLEENIFLRRNKKTFTSLTKRQKEILRLMALGWSACEIAKELSISEETASTHRRNIRTKLGATSNYNITQFAQAFDLI